MDQSRAKSTTSARFSGLASYHAHRADPATRPDAAAMAPCRGLHDQARRHGATSRNHGNRDATTK